MLHRECNNTYAIVFVLGLHMVVGSDYIGINAAYGLFYRWVMELDLKLDFRNVH